MGGSNMKIKAKVINLLLNDGTLQGLINVTDSSWTLNGELLASPRETIEDLLTDEACNRYGVYLLLSSSRVYVGQSTNLRTRIEQHILGKEWWERAILLTTKDDSLNRSDIDYLESVLIQKALMYNTLDSENKNKGNKQKLDRFQREIMNQYLEGALFLLELIGITVFSEKKEPIFIPNLPDLNRDLREIRAKGEAVAFLKKSGLRLSKYVSYAKLQEKKGVFWINPSVEFVKEDWTIILNDQERKSIYILSVPADTFKTSAEGKLGKLVIRKDKPQYLDLNIDLNTYKDDRSNCSFAPYLVNKIKY